MGEEIASPVKAHLEFVRTATYVYNHGRIDSQKRFWTIKQLILSYPMNSFPDFIFSIASNLFELVGVLGAFLIAVGLFLRYDWFVDVNSTGMKKEG